MTVNRLLAMLFLMVALPTCLALTAVTPIGSVADEPSHIIRAGSLAGGEVLGHVAPVTLPGTRPMVLNGLDVDPALPLSAWNPLDGGTFTRERLNERVARAWAGHTEFLPIGPIGGYFPIFYVPSAAAIAFDHAIGAAPFSAVRLGRLANILSFTLLGGAALLVARRGRCLMLATLLVPETLHLAASFNQDGLLIAAATLAAALLSRAADDLVPPRQPWYWLAAALIAAIAIAKPPYLALGLLLLLPLPARGRWRADGPHLLRRAGVLVVVALPALVWTWLMVRYASSPLPRAPYEAGPLWPGPRPAPFDTTDMAAQLQVLLAAPARFITLPLHTILTDPWLPDNMVGVLGWLDVLLPAPLYAAWFAVAWLALAADATRPAGSRALPRLSDTLVTVLAVLLVVWAIWISQYLAWTTVGKDRIDGPSGRYLLPLVPFVAVALPRLPLPFAGSLARLVPLAIAAMGLAGTYLVPPILAATYLMP